jgi:hypothetical protein
MTQPKSYCAFGLSIRSTHQIPGLSAGPASVPDIQISFSAPPKRVAELDDTELWYAQGRDDGLDGLRVWRVGGGAYFRLSYSDGTDFFIDRAGTEVHAIWRESSTLEDTSIYLLGPVLGFALRLRGISCLHASAVEIDGRAIALLGPAQAGKSTTAAAFAELGYPVLTDDVAPIVEVGGVLHVRPAYPQLRLWPDSVTVLYGSEDVLPPLTPTWTKRGLDLRRNGYRFARDPLPLAAIYVLGARQPNSGVRIEAMTGRDRMRVLLAHSYVGYLLDRDMREQEFVLLARLVSQIAIRRVIAADDPCQVFQLCARILEDCEAIGCTASPTMAR